MMKRNLPQGRKPLTNADMADLTRRLAITAIEQSELYQAAKRDAEEAEVYAAELEKKLCKLTVAAFRVHDSYWNSTDGVITGMFDLREALRFAELKGENDE